MNICSESRNNVNISKIVFLGPNISKEFEFSINKVEFIKRMTSLLTLGTEVGTMPTHLL